MTDFDRRSQISDASSFSSVSRTSSQEHERFQLISNANRKESIGYEEQEMEPRISFSASLPSSMPVDVFFKVGNSSSGGSGNTTTGNPQKKASINPENLDFKAAKENSGDVKSKKTVKRRSNSSPAKIDEFQAKHVLQMPPNYFNQDIDEMLAAATLHEELNSMSNRNSAAPATNTQVEGNKKGGSKRKLFKLKKRHTWGNFLFKGMKKHGGSILEDVGGPVDVSDYELRKSESAPMPDTTDL